MPAFTTTPMTAPTDRRGGGFTDWFTDDVGGETGRDSGAAEANERIQVPILMYHGVADEPAAAARPLSVPPATFAAQLAHLDELGFRPVTLSTLAAAWSRDGCAQSPPLPERPIALTFDDGYGDFHSEALPLLRAYGFAATLFVTTGWIEDDDTLDAWERPDRMLTWSQLRDVAAAGVEIAGHTHSHPELDQLAGRAVRIELRRSKELLENELGVAVTGLAYPYGYSCARVRRAVRDVGYRYACAVGNTLPRRRSELMALPRLTVRRSTSLTTFDRIVRCRRLPAIYAKDRVLTKGYAMVRRTRMAFKVLDGA